MIFDTSPYEGSHYHQFKQGFSAPTQHWKSGSFNTNANFANASTSGVAEEIAPSLYLGSHQALHSPFLASHNIKIIVNCSRTTSFLASLATASLSSDVIVLSLDPAFDANAVPSSDSAELVRDFVHTHNRTLQNYINHFYVYNPAAANLVHELPSSRLDVSSPILTGNLKLQFFNVLRLMSLCKSINPETQVLIVSETPSSLSTGLAVAYLMDTYNYNVGASLQAVRTRAPFYSSDLNHNYYDDLLIIENLKKFGAENSSLKQRNPGLLTSNCRLKRRGRDDDEPLLMPTPGDRKRRTRF